VRPLTRRLYAIIGVLLSTGAFGVALAYQYPSIVGTVSVIEPISISPNTVEVTGFPNDRFTLNFTVNNGGRKPITLAINATVTATPRGGNRTDVSFVTAAPFDAIPGENTASVVAIIGNGAVPGSYRIAITFCRLSESNTVCG
jgi:hypothetical protein